MHPILWLLTLLSLLLTACSAESSSKPRMIPNLAGYHYACATGNQTYIMLSSKAELAAFIKQAEQNKHCLGNLAQFQQHIQQANINFEQEALILIQYYYGGTGMAKAALRFSHPSPDTLTAHIDITVPPPPVTPNIAVFKFTFAVPKKGLKQIDIVDSVATLHRFELLP